ncbi:MAG TPA: SRPBCC family protein [Gemmatimonadales bacterium]|nr:SRPBCC family protein [Longimicrobium sp.]
MREHNKLLTGLAVGAGAMYLLDPERGARRRSLLRDRSVRASRVLGEGFGTAARDVRNRSTGAAASIRSRLHKDVAGDDVIEQRVRSALGRAVSHPGAIRTAVHEGRVFLSGPVLADELDDLLDTVRRVRGVREVENQLQVHEHAAGVPALQGEGRPRPARSPLAAESWSPTTRLAVGGIGGALAARGLRASSLPGFALGAAGVALLARAVTNLPARRLVGVGAGHGAVDVQKVLRVAVPVEEVWALWSNFESFPRFMAHLRDVRRVSDERSHWTAAAPGGVAVEWDAVLTRWEPRQAIAWTSVPGSMVENAGTVQFRRVGDDATEIELRLSYAPPAGALGHAVAALLGGDLRRLLDDDMVRLKSLLEEGKTSAGGEQVRKKELEAARTW